ncbi:hypothetical protein PHAVU_003G277100 [Phaseolus vulgaris]|uniref:Peptidase A1 domain-containing protein n=1 Tax=Phaseolus vulgaris TaxID=3885 RepID=V7CGB4_PHAVU|nr:hypothetical protein PHAVU_003G277100g [Phaseolus vulgaris]ESW28320.1 hypothetical protein PHAVU_003G277100g [Phaseolus vulgaris]
MATTPKSQCICFFALILLGIIFDLFIFSEATTLELILTDSPLSPFYDPSLTNSDRLRSAFQSSLKRAKRFRVPVANLNHGNTQSPMTTDIASYLMKFSIGTPPVEAFGIADTGSDLIWTQCLPCKQCYNQTAPLFDPSYSKSYTNLPCNSSFCNPRSLNHPECDQNGSCVYHYSYYDHSHTGGNLATETLTIGEENPITFPNTVFGCAHDSGGTFNHMATGIIGLGLGNLSLLSQLGIRKLSYCLAPNNMNSTSKIVFGEDAVVSGAEVVSTPFRVDFAPEYIITLEGFSVEGDRVEFESASNVSEGNMAIDSGTTLTLLPHAIYDGLVAALDRRIKAPKGKDPDGVLDHCYEFADQNVSFPIITAHFKGADVQLMGINTFYWVSEKVVCLSMIPSKVGFFGNIAQTNFWIGYDLDAATVSFKAANCSL